MTAEVLEKFSELITSALGLVTALAWNAAIQQLFTRLFGEAGESWPPRFSTPSWSRSSSSSRPSRSAGLPSGRRSSKRSGIRA